jgi:predicted nuclease of predicted toxin-antitoxin system
VRSLADENVEAAVADALREGGHDVLCVGDATPGASDLEVFDLASAEDRVILTNDKDFGELAYREARVAAGILLLRLGCASGAEKADRLASLMASVTERLRGRFVVVTDRGIRFRPLHRTTGDTR